MRVSGPYYYGKHKWDNYLLDVQDTIKAGDDAHQQSMREQAKALGAAHQEHLEALREQTEQMHRIEDALSGGFEGLRADFEWGFTLMVDRMETQIDHLSQIAARLDAIHKTLQSPLLTQARELFQLGQEHFRKGLPDKALEAYLKAEEKNEVDFPLQLQIGKLFLYGRDEDDDVIDLPKAEKHLLLAARYADAEKGTFPQWNEYCGQAYFHAAIAAYLIGEEEQAAGRSDSMRTCLERALVYLGKAAILWPRFTEIVYTQAKCHALLGQIQDASHKLEILSDRDRRYFEKASQDGDFEGFRADVEDLFRRATVSPGPLARATRTRIDEVSEAVAWAKRSAPTSEDMTVIESIERELFSAKQSLPTLDIDIETLNEQIHERRASLEKMTQVSFRAKLDSSQRAISECESRKTSCESAIEQLKVTIEQTSGAGMGCLFAAIVVFVIFPIGTGILFAVLPPEVRTFVGQSLAGLVPVVYLLVGGIVWAFAAKLWRDHKNYQHVQQRDTNARALDECAIRLQALREQFQAWNEALHGFESWRMQRVGPPPVPSSGR
jgi:tetratricopeptide (TPR) repeat protein